MLFGESWEPAAIRMPEKLIQGSSYRMLKKVIRAGVMLSLALPLAALAQEAATEVEPIILPAVDPLVVEGDINIAGSSTVFPLSEAVAELFRDEGYMGNITIASVGSGAGLERFCVAGEIDIANASRVITEEEIEACRAIGREPIEFRVGTDALTVVVSARNDFVDELTLEQLYQIFSGQAGTWAGVNPEWPAEPIQLFSPGSDSGTFDYFVEAVFEGVGGLDGDDAAAALLNAPNIQLSEDDNVLVAGVQASPYAIGYFGYAYYQENADNLKALIIDGVEPTEETAQDNSYPLSRPLFMYSDAGIINEKPQVGDFINLYLSHVNEVIIDVGYFPTSVEALNVAKARLLLAQGLTDQIPADLLEALQAEGEAEAAG